MLEILAPAGNIECANAAINSGADAIYLGLASSFSARQGAENFDEAAFRAVLQHAHICGVKVYVALNTVIKATDGEFARYIKDLLFVWNEGVDAIIMQDPLLGKKVHELYPEIVLHLSTQAGVCNVEGAKFAKLCGFSRVILARETPIAEIKKIAAFIETEAFVQGALCTCFSGQCYFSSFIGGNSGNRGRCKQPCRKIYAYDRNGNTEQNYALSLSDLCVGENIEKLIEAGVVSFKIEGRMRRKEYVAAAVAYYRAILDQEQNATQKLSDLKRTYNRGNYTAGLAFGQDKRFLSTAVQGHLGEKIGVVKVLNGAYHVESRFQPQNGDAFKILRDGNEVGGAIYAKQQRNGFVIMSKTRLKNGDSVFITTDTALNSRLLNASKKAVWKLDLCFVEGKKAYAIWKDCQIESDCMLQSAQNRALSVEEIKTCFYKTDGLPVDIVLNDIQLQGNIFIAKSELNAFRRKVYQAIVEKLCKANRPPLQEKEFTYDAFSGTNSKTAVISDDFSMVSADVAVYKPKDYQVVPPNSFLTGAFEKYVYYPAFATQADLDAIKAMVKEYALDGIYAENYGGIPFALDNTMKLFAGTGFNLSNPYSVDALLGFPYVAYYAISKELHEKEGAALLSDKAFALSSGNIKIMDLCYCPFGKTCAKCDKKDIYTLTDENGRKFPVRRYVSADGNCRFEVYNCAQLIGLGVDGAGKLLDLTLVENKEKAIAAKNNETLQKQVYETYTSGHLKRGVM